VTTQDTAEGESAEPDSSAAASTGQQQKVDITEHDAVSRSAPAGRVGTRLLSLTLPGCWGALIVACLSFTPSLLPRSGLIQGTVCGIGAAIGYGFGVLAAWIWRAYADREMRTPKPWAWPAFAVAGSVLIAVSFALGQYWQHQIRQLMGVSDYNVLLAVLSPLVAGMVFWLLLGIGRGVRGVYRWVVKLLHRWIGQSAAKATGWILVAAVTYLLISGLLLDGFVNLANDTFSVRNRITPEGVVQPTSSLRSGGTQSLVPWDSLGREGRKFVATGPTVDEITQLTKRPAKQPIRAYAGLESADTTEERAALAVRDLTRAGGFARKNLLVVSTTGSGWVDPASADTFEYLTDGDSAIVAIQYSYLPSWISYLVDQKKAREAGRALFDAVYGTWSTLPEASRPRLYVAGESLGSFGGEAAFSGEDDIRNRTAGALFVGPPNFNTLFREFTDGRDSGSPEIEPVFKGGRTVRFTNDPTSGIPPQQAPWDGPRALYLMHSSDPIVWWTPRLLFSKPDWMREARGPDVLHQVVWIPVLTFWQVTADLPFAVGVPSGHGHKYSGEYVDAWAAVLQPSDAAPSELANLRALINAEG
jgi:uncharacterized membrane protein